MKKRRTSKTSNKTNIKNPILKKEVKHKPFWALLGILLLVTFIIFINKTQTSLNLTGHAVQVISYQPQGSQLFFEIRNVPNLKDGTAHFSDTVKNSKITINEQSIPKFKGTALSAFDIESPESTKISQIDLTFKIKKTNITNAKLLPAELTLYQNDQPVYLSIEKEEGEYTYFKTTINMFGTYILGKSRIEITSTPTTTTPELKETTPPPQLQEPKALEEQKPIIVEQPKPLIISITPSGEATQPPATSTTSQPLPKPSIWQKTKDFFKNIFR